ncbi:hypothetical protein [Pedobacter sp. UBA5917]|uniref:hypothetical protein n=1 Tax=Pedobacter sp. UBA5917 TaxID=1947061 RepID=UPI0025E06AB8|nr:hypothetical protein [Pedobacter sp. UBA5917]
MIVDEYKTDKKMNFVSEFFKGFIKLFVPLLVAMLGVGHSIVEVSSLINHTAIFVFGFKYDPTLWTVFITLFVTIIAIIVVAKVMLNLGKSYKKDC